MKAIGYVRVSTDDQTQGVSLAAQRAKIDAYCVVNGAELLRIYADEGLSGKRADNRPALQRALDEACRRKAVLVVYSLTRLARSTRDTLTIAERLERAGADLASISEKIDTTTAAGKMVFRMLAVLAEFERDQVSERTAMALAHKRTTRRRYTNVAPFGYAWRADRLVDNPAERPHVATILRLRGDGLGYKAIAAELERQHVPTRYGGRWNWSSVRSICTARIRGDEK
jgi:site-specific DNA recombinase